MQQVQNVNTREDGQKTDAIRANGNDPASLKNEFMSLMIAQIKNQDPTNPLDASEYLGQLAQFSQVESLEAMRQNQKNQMTMMENLGLVQSASLIGKQAMVPADSFTAAEHVIDGKVYLEHSASAVTVEISDKNGEVVKTLELGSQAAGDVSFQIDPEGLGLPPGEYQLKVQASDGEKALKAQSFLAGEINKVHFVSAKGMMMAELANGLGTVSVLDISEVS
ncbi:FlgD immunoglobulin-like domain containing protein [Shewanella algae]|uniref:FlgD immunoglobulin-like domain containing protein n=1 Tax=Shewanella algae TaxID=38313 RepID=UPI00118405F1|nr:FlgD immunoglobulin-like domain containing protein [Shewanella algae]MBO2567259.1 flagellar biosynthesis protein FlgD [Shewanella algae]MBO2655907.1 flagellar biosynthesis protein FlgD [Shewanella algae]MBO2694141.1 flagellar biosynthesis protein FlgD [Shewanella algae]MCE9780351.1 flagellar biosynthesis protein FlgD [Shewanella algae]MCE9826695.1 flagellar biosynthesis protein FlgD [Shewanella algae]